MLLYNINIAFIVNNCYIAGIAYLVKQELLALLKELDLLLTGPIEITVCGGAAGILCHGFSRGTLDIDLVLSQPALSTVSGACRSVALAHEIAESWINDSAKGFVDYLPDGFLARRIPVDGPFAHLRVFALARPDLLVMKLAAFRPEDIADVESMGLGSIDTTLLESALRRIAGFDSRKAHVMSLFLREKGVL